MVCSFKTAIIIFGGVIFLRITIILAQQGTYKLVFKHSRLKLINKKYYDTIDKRHSPHYHDCQRPAKNLDFIPGRPGLKLAKKTINFDARTPIIFTREPWNSIAQLALRRYMVQPVIFQ